MNNGNYSWPEELAQDTIVDNESCITPVALFFNENVILDHLLFEISNGFVCHTLDRNLNER